MKRRDAKSAESGKFGSEFMPKIKMAALVFVALACEVLFSSCAASSRNRDDGRSWKTGLTGMERFLDASLNDSLIEVPDDFVFLVPEATKANAEDMLRRRSYIMLSQEKAAELLLKDVAVAGYYPFLVRGVFPGAGSSYGRFQCCVAKKSLWVDYSEMGDKLRPLRKQPLVLFLKEKPQFVFVTYSVSK